MSVSACQTTGVRTDAAANSPADCRSYAWQTAAAPASDAFVNPINEERLRRAVAQRLEARGVRNEAGNADCLVSVAIGSRHDIAGSSRSRWSFGFGTGFGSRGSRSGASVGFGTSTGGRAGRVAVDVYRAADRAPLWHGTADIDATDLTGARAERRIDAAVDAIFRRFPQ